MCICIMSEQKRVPTQTLDLSGSLVNATKKEKKGEKGKQHAPSFRFVLSLDDKSEKGYSEFSYAHLLKAAEKKRGKEQKNSDENAVNGLDPFDEDDDQKLREMAKRFEAKYGTTTAGKNRKKYDDDVDLGAGYDENDSFIDNTDAYDEVVPEGVTTAYGGFYINSGPLEFSVKPEEQNSVTHRNNNNNDDDSSDSSDEEVEDSNSPDSKRRNRLLISSSEDDDDEIVTEPVIKKIKFDENGEKKSNDDIIKKKKKIIGDQQNLDNSNRHKNIDDKSDDIMEVDGALESQDERKKLHSDVARVKSKKLDIRKFVKEVTVNGNDDKKMIDGKKQIGKDSNIDDAIESVVNDGRIEDESSRDTVDSGKSRCVAGTSSECEDMDKMDIRLPDNLPDNIRDIIIKLKKAAEHNKEGKIKFFDASVNSTLFSLEKKLRIQDSSTMRSQVYAHLAHFLSCSKVTLANRAKKLCLQDTEGKVKEPIQRLKAIIDGSMPSVIEKYNSECQRIIEEKGVDASLSDRDSSDGNEKPSEKSKMPRKIFPWSSEAKRLVYEIASEWRQYYKIRKPRKESMETFLASFMENKIVRLWPQGWMKREILLKYANSEPAVKKKQKKTRETSISNNNPTTTLTNCSVRLEMGNMNNVTQERVKTPTNFVKISVDNPVNYISTSQKSSSDVTIDRKQMSIKHKDKIRENPVASQDDGNNQSSVAPVAKISLVPTSQLMAQKPTKCQSDKFNPMDLTSSSLSITPVNDYQKANKSLDEVKKDTVSITPYSECSSSINPINSDTIHTINRSHITSSSTSTFMPVSLKQRIIQDNVDSKVPDRSRLEDRDCDSHMIDVKEKKRERWPDDKYKSHDSKKRRKEHKTIEQSQHFVSKPVATDISSAIMQTHSTTLSREEQEQRQIEETMAATNFLSQMINDDAPRLTMTDKRKESNVMIDDSIGNIVQPSEQEKDVQMVMRSLKELQELQEMNYSPSHSPLQKPKSSHQYIQSIGFNDEYHRHYHKKDEKLRLTKDEPQW